MYKVLLNLEGSLQSWGGASKYANRATLDCPTKSGVLGILCASQGISMANEPVKAIELSDSFSMKVYVIKKGRILKDFQTIGTNYSKKDNYEKRYLLRKRNDKGKVSAIADCPTKIFVKDYLAEAHFIAELQFLAKDVAERVQESLASPTWPLYLGRKCCIPTWPIPFFEEGVIAPADSVREPLLKVLTRVLPEGVKELVTYVEDSSGLPIPDVFLGGGEYGVRFVKKEKQTI